jgi:hypothetical protein
MINVTVAPETAELPAVGTTIFLVLGEGVNFRTRLESAAGESFEVTAPLETTGPNAYQPGDEFEIFWMPFGTRMTMSCRLTTISDSAPYRWVLTPLGRPQQSNRREFVRGGGGAAVRLMIESGGDPVEGALLDISEGGLRCWFDEPVSLTPGDLTWATVWLGEEQVELTGTVHTVRPAPHGDPGIHVILTFETEESTAQMIRLYILAWEINERRLHREQAAA